MAEFADKAASPRHTSAAPTAVISKHGRPSSAGDPKSGPWLGRLRATLNQSPPVQAATQLSRRLNRGSHLSHYGTPAHKRLDTPQAEPGYSSVAQRLIALDVKPQVDMQQDMPALKVLAQLKQFLAHSLSDSQVFLLEEGLDFSRMRQGETLYIAGHGTPGSLYGVTPDALLEMLNDPEKGVPASIARIIFLVCNAGTLEFEQDQGSSLVSKIAMGLRHPGITVVGATGYTFGAPSTAERGFNRVMPFELWDIEKATDEDEIAKKLSPQPMTNELKQAARGSQDANQAKVEGALTFGEAFDSHDQLIAHCKRFFTRKTELEEQLSRAVTKSQPPQQTGAEAINSVVGALKSDVGFGDLVKQQNALYEEFGFFHRQDEYAHRASLGGSAALKDPDAHKLFLDSLSWAERLTIGRQLNPDVYDQEIGATLAERALRIVEVCSTVTKHVTPLILAFDSVGQQWLQGVYQRNGGEQQTAVEKARLAAPRISDTAKSMAPNVLFDLVPELTTLRADIRRLHTHFKESTLFKGVMTYLSANGQADKAKEIDLLAKAVESSEQQFREALDVTALQSDVYDWIHQHA